MKKVLIIDDSLTVRMDLQEFFDENKIPTLLSASAEEAYRTLKENEDVGLLILDKQLPDQDGISFLKILKSNPKYTNLPVIILSGEIDGQNQQADPSHLADEYLGKPYDQEKLLTRAKELLSKETKKEDKTPSQNILVIDDSPTFQNEIKNALEEKSYRVTVAKTGEEGLSLAMRNRFHAIIVDGELPGIKGSTVIARIRELPHFRDTPCLLLTANERSESSVLEAGADSFIKKSDDFEVLFAKLGALIRQARTRSLDTLVDLKELGPKKILAVDDSLTYIHELEDQLKDEGYEVRTAQSGEEALEILKKESFDCILLDRIMPGLSGQETCRRIKSSPEGRDIPLIMLTAHEDRESMLEGFSAGADDYIPKSSEVDVLKARLRAQLRRKQFEDESKRIQKELLQKEAEAAESRAQLQFAQARAELLDKLKESNKELEAFSYSVSHDLRAPLRRIQAFCQSLREQCKDKLPQVGVENLERIDRAVKTMTELIDGLIDLSRVSRQTLDLKSLDLSALVKTLLSELKLLHPERKVDVVVADKIVVQGDSRMLQSVLQNLLSNAWKFTSKTPEARIEFGLKTEGKETIYFVKDNGAGFDMAHADRLFGTFERLHSESEFEGTGIGLATVRRIIQRHGGRIWAEGVLEKGATFYFTLGKPE